MKKNWAVFFVICAIAYGFVFYQQSKKMKAFEAEKLRYKVEFQDYTAKVKAKQAELDTARKALEEAHAKVAGLPPAEDSGTTDTLKVPSISEERRLLTKLATISDTKKHTIDTPLYSVIFTELGARPIDWEIKSSEYVRNLAEDGDRNATTNVQLIPQVADQDARSLPFQLAGYTARDFNSALFSETEEKVTGGTKVTFTSDPIDDLVVVKEFLFRDDSYVVDLTVKFENGPATRKKLGREKGLGIGWQGGFGTPEVMDRVHGFVNFVAAADGSIRTHTVKRTDAAPYAMEANAAKIDWIGQEKKFFALIMVPDAANPATSAEAAFDKRDDEPAYQVKGANIPISVELYHPSKDLDPGESFSLRYQVYAGPKNRDAMKAANFNLAAGSVAPGNLIFHTIPLGMSFMRQPCHWLLSLMKWLHGILGTWGVAIICVTIIVRTAIYPITHWAIKNQARTMIEQQKIKPEMEAINKKYKNDPMKKNQAVMQLYRDHKVNPLGFVRGCFPVLLQMPIFMSLYVVFEQSVELRGQSFLWIPDLSGPDRLIDWSANLPLLGHSLNILPIIMAVTNFLQMRIMRMPASDETQEAVQKQMMYMMPVMFIFFLYHLPSGLILYWVVSNCISIGQSYMTKRIIASHMAEHEAAKSGLVKTGVIERR